MNYKTENIEIDFKCNLSNKFVFLPENIESANSNDEYIFTDTLTDLNKIFRSKNIEFEIFGGNSGLQRSRKSADLYLPAILISYAVLSENANLISVALNLISNYVTDFFKGSKNSKKVNLEIYVETEETKKTKKIIKKITYQANSEGLKELPEILKSIK